MRPAFVRLLVVAVFGALLGACSVEQITGRPTSPPVVVVVTATPGPNQAPPTVGTALTALPLETSAPTQAATEAATAAPVTAAPATEPPATAAPAADAARLCIAGSNTILGADTAAMQQAWADALIQRNVAVTIDGSGSEAAVEAARAGECVDALLASEPLNGGQIAQLDAAGIDAGEPTIIGYDAIAFVTNRTNQAPPLTLGQISDVLNGEVSNWSEVGGPQLPMRVFLRPGSGTTNYVLINVADFEPFVTVPGQPFPPDLEFTECVSNSACFEQVAATEGAFYYATKAIIRNAAVRPILVRAANGVLIDPTGLAFDRASYPAELLRPLYAYSLTRENGDPDAEIAAALFRSYVLSERGQQTLIAQGFFGAE
jgi:phosphate transport system substrate-binding protein